MVSAILLAAGLSRRMGDLNKLQLPLYDKTILETTLDNLVNANFDEIIIVCSPVNKDFSFDIAQSRIRKVVNENYLLGMTTSIKEGVLALHPKSKGAFICLADMPLIESNVYDLLIEEMTNSLGKIIVPTYKGKRGNPVGFSRSFFGDILNEEDLEGCKNVVQSNLNFVIKIDVKNASILFDLDTVDDYLKIRKE